MTTVMDQALVMLDGCGPEFGAGELSNHGPMAAEALSALGRPEEVEPWVERYRRRLGDPPARVARITHENWREALGNVQRATDWEDFFAAELDSAPWREGLETWVPLLAPGLMAASTHGIIRTAHAVRSLAADERSTERKSELVRGLAYWAARYQLLPGSSSAGVPARLASQALPELPIMPRHLRNPRPLNIFHAVAELDSFEPFAAAIDLAVPTNDLSAWLSDLTASMASLYLLNAGPGSIAYVHTVTAPSALRIMLPYLSDETARLAARYAWQSCAAIHSREHSPHEIEVPAEMPSREDLIDRAVFSGDEHAIKFTEACLREYDLRPDPAFLAGPLDLSNRYGRRKREGQPTNP